MLGFSAPWQVYLSSPHWPEGCCCIDYVTYFLSFKTEDNPVIFWRPHAWTVSRKDPDSLSKKKTTWSVCFGGFQIVLRKNKDFNDIWAQSGLAWALMTWPKGHESNVARDSLTYIDILCIQWVLLSSSRQTREHLKKVL